MNIDFNSLHILHAIRQIPSSLITSYEKLVLFTMLSSMNKKNFFYDSIDNIAQKSCITRRGLQKIIKKLEEKKFIFLKKPHAYGRGNSTEYSLNVELIMIYHPSKGKDKNIINGEPCSPFLENKRQKSYSKKEQEIGINLH